MSAVLAFAHCYVWFVAGVFVGLGIAYHDYYFLLAMALVLVMPRRRAAA